MKIRVFTDGSSLISKDKTMYESSSAVMIYVDGNLWYEFGKYHEGGTNSLGEVYAIKLAFDKLYEHFTSDELTDVQIICDSEYVVKSCTKWIYNWTKNNWIGSKGDEIKFVDIFKELYEKYLCKKIRNRNIKILHIKSHKNTSNIKKLLKMRLDFQARNEIELSQDEFNWFLDCNDKVDRLAGVIRYSKSDDYINDIGEENHRWETKNGRIVIRRNLK